MVVSINKGNLDEVLASGKPVVIDFGAEWCGPCRAMEPIIHELAEAYGNQVIIGQCDVEENDEIAVKYGVRNIPTIIFIKGGEVAEKQVGACSKDALKAKIDNLL